VVSITLAALPIAPGIDPGRAAVPAGTLPGEMPEGPLPGDRPAGTLPGEGDVVFCFSYLSWQAAADRGWFGTEDRLARGLLRHERVRRLLVCDLVRSLPARVVRDVQVGMAGRAATFPAGEGARLLRPTRLRRDYPTRIGGVRRACAALDRALGREARRMGLREPAVIVANPLLAGFADFDWAGSVTFFATDDWLSYEPHRRWWPAYAESFSFVRARARRVCAVSEAALAQIAPAGGSAVLPNGVDPEEWRGALAPPPAWARELPRPLLLYTGSLDERLDVPALLGLARALPEASVVLVGPLLAEEHLAPLRAEPNICIRPPLPRAELIALTRAADAGLLVHRDLPLTRAMSPLKLYEYLAAGLPVVATDLPPVRGVHPSIELVAPAGGGAANAQEGDPARGDTPRGDTPRGDTPRGDTPRGDTPRGDTPRGDTPRGDTLRDDTPRGEAPHGDYVRAVRAALTRGRAAEASRHAFIERNSWRARHDALLDLVLA
jgi:teichuronic acid biosynthesis glycosyltransferase TuaH